jgi:enterochelin esterase-like enzyme
MNEDNLTEETSVFTVRTKQGNLYSEYLEREVIIDIYVPEKFDSLLSYDLLLINDGQDLLTIDFGELLSSLLTSLVVVPLICVGIHAGADRLNEYGTICRADYMGRGSKAGIYSKFVFDELLPFIHAALSIPSFKSKSFAGFSLGALSALDIVWNHPAEFVKAGVFSGALWWRRHGYEDGKYNWEKDRIMHLQIQKGKWVPWLNFFFECGRLDETADRNNNGIIDSIEDTTDLIAALKDLGYNDNQVFYLELEDGKHDMETWKRAFPEFLKWGWGIQAKD